jgi:SulP family sulfate permease
MVLSAFLFIRRMAEVTNVTMVTREMADADEADDAEAVEMARKLPPGVVLYEINGPFFFGAAERFKEVLNRVSGSPRVLVVRLQHVPAIDSTGLHALRELAHGKLSGRTKLVLADVHAQPMLALTNSGLLDVIGAENVFDSLDRALARAAELVSRPKTPPVVSGVACAEGRTRSRHPFSSLQRARSLRVRDLDRAD